MTDDLLVYYNRELTYLRKLGREFSRAHPDVAPELRLESETGQDPFVERLLEGFAYLTARTRKKLDDDFPEIAEALLNVLYPQFLAPLPSAAIVQFELDAGQASQKDGHAIEAGAMVETEEVDGEACLFRTCFDLRLYPLRVAEAGLLPIARAPVTRATSTSAAVVRIALKSFGKEPGVGAMKLDNLRFFIKGNAGQANALHELLCCHVVDVAIASGLNDQNPILLGPDALRQCGFSRHEAMFPFPERSSDAYRLLTEYFALPEKFRFVEFCGLSQHNLSRFGQSAELLVYVNRNPDILANNVSASNFRLGCTPIVNLFTQAADPITVSGQQSEYHVAPDVRRAQAMEIVSIDLVEAALSSGEVQPVYPLFATSHARDPGTQRAYWHASRRAAGYRDGQYDPGTEMDISLVDLNFSPQSPPDWTLTVHTTCCNRDLPERLDFHDDEDDNRRRPRMRLLAGGPLAPLRCLSKPTPTRRPPLGHSVVWRLVSHLSLNHLSLISRGEGVRALREILALYDFLGTPDRRAKIDGIVGVHGAHSTARIESGDAGFCRGVAVRLDLDERRFADHGQYLFCAVLERFLGLYCSINSFSQLTVHSATRGAVLYEWPPRAGEKQLL